MRGRGNNAVGEFSREVDLRERLQFAAELAEIVEELTVGRIGFQAFFYRTPLGTRELAVEVAAEQVVCDKVGGSVFGHRRAARSKRHLVSILSVVFAHDGFELFFELQAGAVEATADRTDGQIKDFGDGVVIAAIDLAENNNRAVLFAQLV